jgi:hypothetical protein
MATNYDEYECVLSSNKHFVRHPIILRCGHYICKECTPESNTLICNKCGEAIVIRSDKESLIAKEMIKRNIEQLLGIVEFKFTESFSKFKSNIRFSRVKIN